MVMRNYRPGNVLLRPNTWQLIFLNFTQAFIRDFNDKKAEFDLFVF